MMHPVDIVRKTRDKQPLSGDEIAFLVTGAAAETLPAEQLAAWLMAARLNGLTREEIHRLTVAMRDSGARFDPRPLGRVAVDKHSTGGVGDKTSFLVAPIAAACGLVVPMISGRALGHTGGTLDKLESIPGLRTALSLDEFAAVLRQTHAAIVSQTPDLVPADRVLYALRDRTATVESPGLICASILSKKLAAGLDALVLDVKTGSGAFLRDRAEAEYLAALLVATANAAGTRTVALLTEMSQPLGSAAGNWIEVAEAIALLRNQRSRLTEDLRELSLQLAAWMLHLGGISPSPDEGYIRAGQSIVDGSALACFRAMVAAQGGDASVMDHPEAVHQPAITHTVVAPHDAVLGALDTTALGWAIQRLGVGRAVAGAAVDPHAGAHFHIRVGDRITAGQPLATLYASSEQHLAEALPLFTSAMDWSAADEFPRAAIPLIHAVIDAESAENILRRHNP